MARKKLESIASLSPTERVRALVDRYASLWLILSGLLLGFTVIFPQIGFLEWIALVPAAAVFFVRASNPAIRLRKIYGMGLLFFLSFLLVTFHWFLYMYPLDFAGMSRPASAVVVMVAWIGLATFQALGAALIVVLFAIASRGKWLSRHTALLPLLLACLWTVLEWFWANSGWSGVPWSRLALGQAELLPVMQSAWLFGSYAVSFLLVLVNGYLAYLLLHPNRRILCATLAGGLFCANLAFGFIRLSAYEDGDRTIQAAAIQGNMSSLEFWQGSEDTVMAVYERLTREAVENGAELVLWPETGIAQNIDREPQVYDFVTGLARDCGVPILAGVFTDVGPDSLASYNSIVVALPDGTLHKTVYHKRNPVPFGEFVPWRNVIMTLVPPLAEINTLGEDIPAGTESVVFDLECGNVGSLICFDSIYEINARDSIDNGAELLAVSTNDSWFRDSRGVWMHHAQSQYRAIETGRYVVRSAVTGVSSVISATGEVKAYLPALEEGYVLSEVTMRTERTPYMVIGNLFSYIALGVASLAVLATPVELVVAKWRKK